MRRNQRHRFIRKEEKESIGSYKGWNLEMYQFKTYDKFAFEYLWKGKIVSLSN